MEIRSLDSLILGGYGLQGPAAARGSVPKTIPGVPGKEGPVFKGKESGLRELLDFMSRVWVRTFCFTELLQYYHL